MAGGYADYGTFVPILGALLARTRGPVLDLGSGDYSTPLLHFACQPFADHPPRKVVTVDTDPAWLKKYESYRTDWHELHLVQQKDSAIRNDSPYYRWLAGWNAWPVIEREYWSLALVDNAPGECRVPLIKRLKGHCDFLVVHDSEEDYDVGGNYGYKEVIPLFKYHSEHRRFRPYTLVLSDLALFPIEDLAWKP